jgi:hypothetical protein
VLAVKAFATAVLKDSGIGSRRSALSRRVAPGLARLLAGALLVVGLLGETPSNAASNKVRITNLSDVGFGTIANLNVDAVQSQSVCVYADTNTSGYNVTGIGAGPGGAFQLSSGAASMSFDVLWSSSPGQNSGTQLTPNVPLTGQVSSGTHQTCSNGPATTASLVVVLRSIALSSAAAGTYNGTLTLVIGPE